MCFFCRTNNATMTLPSLCSAIRSQLYFSQITAWSDLLKSSTADIPELFKNPRIKRFSNTNTPKLDILYRIRPYDNTSCFNGKPNVHNFPDTVINESAAIKVCLKSLPRQNAIPKLEPNCGSSSSNSDGVGIAFCNATSVVGQCSSNYMVATADTSQSTMMDRPNNLCVERGKHHCTFDEGMVSDEMDASSPLIPILSHRDRQLLKYKKRLLKREKKKRSDDAMDNCSSGSSGSSSAQSFGTNSLAENADTPQLGDRNSINSIRPPLYSMTNAMQTTLATAKATETVKVEMKSIGTQTDLDTVTVQNQVDHTDVFKYPNCDFCGIEMQYVCWNCDNKLFTETTPRLGQNSTLSSSATTTTSPPCNERANLLLQAIQRTPSVKQSTMRRSLQFDDNKSTNAEASSKMSTVQSLSPCGDGGNKSSCDSASLELSDCHLCKRQKTMHNYFSSTNSSKTNYNNNLSKLNNNNNNNHKSNSLTLTNYKVDSDEDNEDDEDDYAALRDCSLGVPVVSANYHRRTMSESIDAGASVTSGDPEQGIELSRSTNDRTVLSDLELKMYRRAYSEDVLACGCEENAADCSAQSNLPRMSCQITNTITTPNPDEDYSSDEPNRRHQFKTPISHRRTAVMATNYKVNPLYVMCPSEYTQSKLSPIYKKPIPKVNLTKQFSRMPNNDFNDPMTRPSSMDLLLNSSPTLYGSRRSPNAFNFDNLSPISLSSPVSAPTSATIISSSPVHKSNSAPTLPVPFTSPSHSLSPRFLKASAILKRRTRHLSDRSSFGSDELFSDEEFGAGLDNTYSPTLSTSKVSALGMRRFGSTLKPFAKYSFGMRPLLGKLRTLFKSKLNIPNINEAQKKKIFSRKLSLSSYNIAN